MTSIEWVAYKHDLPEVTDGDFNQLEAERKLQLPAPYRALVKAHSGQIPRPANASVGGSQIPVNALFFVKKDFHGTNSSYNAWHYLAELDAVLPPAVAARLVPFTSDSGSGIFVLDYRHGDEPAVALVDLNLDPEEEDAITLVATSLDVFFASLHH